MPIADLLEALTRQGEAEASQVLDEARATAQQIVAQGREQLARRRVEVLAPQTARFRVAAERTITDARRSAMRNVLTARDGLLARIHAAVLERVAVADADPRMVRVLPRLVEEALAYVVGAPVRIECSPDLMHAVHAVVHGKEWVSVAGNQTIGPGVRVVTEDGRVMVDNTLAARFHRLWPRLALGAIAEMSNAND